MVQMVRFELEKLCSRKIVWIGLLCLALLNAGTVMDLQREQYEVITSDGRYLKGKEGREYIKERTEKYAGLLNDRKRARILKEEGAADITDNADLYSLPLYMAMESEFESEFGPFYGKSIDEIYTRNGILVEVGNAERWTKVFYYFQQMVLALGFIIAIAAAGSFSEEYTRKTDALLLTSRHGKKKCVQAKVIAALLFTTVCYGVLLIGNVIPFLLDDGLYGWDAGVQLDYLNELYLVPYTQNCGEAALIFAGCGLLALLSLTGLTLMVSVWSKSSFVSVIVSFLIYFLPMFLSNVLPNKVFCLTPVGAATTIALRMPKFEVGGLELFYQIKILAAAAVVTALTWVVTRRSFGRHQVA